MKCPNCDGKGTTTLKGVSFTGEEWAEMDEDFKEDYRSGDLDETCKVCKGTGKLTKEELEDYYDNLQDLRTQQAESGYYQ